MTKDEALKLAREHIEGNYTVSAEEALAAIKEALAQPEPVACLDCGSPNIGIPATYDSLINSVKAQTQEPVAWEQFYPDIGKPQIALNAEVVGYVAPQRTWVGLTNDEVNNFAAGCHLGKSVQGAIYEAEAKLKEKNT